MFGGKHDSSVGPQGRYSKGKLGDYVEVTLALLWSSFLQCLDFYHVNVSLKKKNPKFLLLSFKARDCSLGFSCSLVPTFLPHIRQTITLLLGLQTVPSRSAIPHSQENSYILSSCPEQQGICLRNREHSTKLMLDLTDLEVEAKTPRKCLFIPMSM